VVAVEELGGGLVQLTAVLPHLARTVRPGEFAHLLCGTGVVPLLRRPMSVARSDGERCAFVFERVGEGTRRLAALRSGDPLVALGPLGAGFTLPSAGHVVCVAGGLGCAPFPLTVRAALAAGAERVTVLSGAPTAARLYPAARYGDGDPRVTVLEATDDGTRGHHGLVTDLVAAAVGGDAGALLACGPNAMLAALADVVAGLEAVPAIAEASLEAPMGCGVGTCLGCALPVRGGDGTAQWALCCRLGPVMPLAAVDWVALRALPPPHVA